MSRKEIHVRQFRRRLFDCFANLFVILFFLAANLTAPETIFATAIAIQEDDDKPKQETQERVYSGPQPGEKISPFKVLRAQDGELTELEIVKESKPATLICFIHRLSNDDRILYGLGMVDHYGLQHDELTSHIVLLSDDRPKMDKMLQNFARGSLFPKSLVSLSVDGVEGPGPYGLNRNVAMTVVVAKGNSVVSNMVFQAPNYRDLETIMKAVAKALGKPEPTLAKIQQEIKAKRKRQMDERIKASPVFKLAPDEQIGRIMFAMVNARGNQAQNAKRLSKQLIEWAGDSNDRKSALKKYCQAVLDGDFRLNQFSRSAIQKLAKD